MGKIGVLALQGDFEAHARALARAGAETMYVRTRADLEAVDGLVIPGGESTTMLKLLHAEDLFGPLVDFGRTKPIFGTCAGAILLATEVVNPAPEFQRRTRAGEMEAVFIRAPIIRRVGDGAAVLASYNGDPVLVEQGRHMVATFHPELTGDTRVHELFLSKL